jgi:hypothetical protein
MPYHMYLIFLETFEAYGRKNYHYVKENVEAIWASWGEEGGASASASDLKELKFWQNLKASIFSLSII